MKLNYDNVISIEGNVEEMASLLKQLTQKKTAPVSTSNVSRVCKVCQAPIRGHKSRKICSRPECLLTMKATYRRKYYLKHPRLSLAKDRSVAAKVGWLRRRLNQEEPPANPIMPTAQL